jgi:hypothetical protein
MERIARTDLPKVYDFSTAVSLSLLPDRVWTDADWDRIQLGHLAKGMDERWNAFAEGNRLFLHRNWTGHRIYEAEFTPRPGGGGRTIAWALVESDPRRHRRASDAYDAVMLELLVTSILLGERSDLLWQRLNELRGHPPAGGPADSAPPHDIPGLRTADRTAGSAPPTSSAP